MPKRIKYPWSEVNLEELDIPIQAVNASTNLKSSSSFVSVKLSEQDTFDTHIRSVTPVSSSISNIAIVFLHGASFSSKNWDEDLNTLAIFGALGYQTFAIDLPGYGKTTKSLGTMTSFSSTSDYLLALIEMLTKNQVILIVPSMSGSYGLPFLKSHSERLAGFLCISPVMPTNISKSILRTVQVPTLLVYGSKDKYMGEACHEYLKAMPNYQAVVMEGAGHAAYMNKPDQFHKIIYNFVKEIEERS